MIKKKKGYGVLFCDPELHTHVTKSQQKYSGYIAVLSVYSIAHSVFVNKKTAKFENRYAQRLIKNMKMIRSSRLS